MVLYLLENEITKKYSFNIIAHICYFDMGFKYKNKNLMWTFSDKKCSTWINYLFLFWDSLYFYSKQTLGFFLHYCLTKHKNIIIPSMRGSNFAKVSPKFVFLLCFQNFVQPYRELRRCGIVSSSFVRFTNDGRLMTGKFLHNISAINIF